MYFCTRKRPDGGIGRRAGLKHQWIHFHAGSIPALGTLKPLFLTVIQKIKGFFICVAGKLQAKGVFSIFF